MWCLRVSLTWYALPLIDSVMRDEGLNIGVPLGRQCETPNALRTCAGDKWSSFRNEGQEAIHVRTRVIMLKRARDEA